MPFATLLLQQAEEGPPPLIDLDGTVAIQLLLFLAMLAILWPLLFRPYLRVRDARRKGIEGARHDAHLMEERAGKIVADYQGRMHQAKLRGADERARLRAEAAAHERQVLAAARQQTHTTIEEQRKHIRTQADAARQVLTGQSATLARQLAKKIIGREVA